MSNLRSLAQVKIPLRSALALRLAAPFVWLGTIGWRLESYAMSIPPTVTESAAMKCHCDDCIAYIRASAKAGKWVS